MTTPEIQSHKTFVWLRLWATASDGENVDIAIFLRIDMLYEFYLAATVNDQVIVVVSLCVFVFEVVVAEQRGKEDVNGWRDRQPDVCRCPALCGADAEPQHGLEHSVSVVRLSLLPLDGPRSLGSCRGRGHGPHDTDQRSHR